MADCVLDTHALLWALARPDKLGKGARRVVDGAGAGRLTAFVPAIVLIEIALLEAESIAQAPRGYPQTHAVACRRA